MRLINGGPYIEYIEGIPFNGAPEMTQAYWRRLERRGYGRVIRDLAGDVTHFAWNEGAREMWVESWAARDKPGKLVPMNRVCKPER
jgi:hypothetical protein